MKKRKEFWP